MTTPSAPGPAPSQGLHGSSLSIATTASTATTSQDQYNFPASGALGALQIGAGVISTVAMVGSFVAQAELYYTGYGIWCALPVGILCNNVCKLILKS